jgi:CheY-like chemotaxis protein
VVKKSIKEKEKGDDFIVSSFRGIFSPTSSPSPSFKKREENTEEEEEGNIRNKTISKPSRMPQFTMIKVSSHSSSTFTKSNSFTPSVLIVDDSYISRKMIYQYIELYYTEKGDSCEIRKIQDARNGAEALMKMYQTGNPFSLSVDVVFTDNYMDQINGILLTKLLRKLDYEGFIIGITGGDEKDVENFYSQGADYVIVKPMEKHIFQQFFHFLQTIGFKRDEREPRRITRMEGGGFGFL